MQNLNIFDEVKQGKFFKFEKVGDMIQGTYIEKTGVQETKYGPQIVYVLKDKEGNVWNYGVNTSKERFHERMNGILFGQIVGFRFDEEKDMGKGNNAKIVRIYADSKFVDNDWLEAQKKLGVDPNRNFGKKSIGGPSDVRPSDDEPGDGDEGNEEGGSVFGKEPFVYKAPEDAAPSGGSLPKDEIVVKDINFDGPKAEKNEALDAIRNLARTKGLTTEGMTQEESDKAIEQYTGLTLEEANLTKIIIKLTGYVTK